MSKEITITLYSPKELWEKFWDRFFWRFYVVKKRGGGKTSGSWTSTQPTPRATKGCCETIFRETISAKIKSVFLRREKQTVWRRISSQDRKMATIG